MVRLPPPSHSGSISLEQTLSERRSVRQFNNAPLDNPTLGQLLWAAQGTTTKDGVFRTAPSAGATYPLQTYAVCSSGIYRYLPGEHALDQLCEIDRRQELAETALNQTWVAEAAVDIVFTARYENTTKRYAERGKRYVLMEAGHAAENIHLQAVALGLGSVPIGAFRDEKAGEVLAIPDAEDPLYIISVGHPR